MTIQDVDKEFQERVLKDMRLMEIRSRMRYGTATFADTAEYNDRASSILGSVLSGRMPSTPNGERAKLCEYLLRHLYTDTNEMCAAVQLTLDKALGIQLAPQKAPFPASRVQAISGSLEDQTVPMETIQRRAGSAATVGRSFHDAYIKTNAEFRDRAGLQSSAIREGGAKCCGWCASVSGKYPASDTPQGFWWRHDNCKCSILYETRKGVQRLGGSTKKLEPLEDAGAPEPVRLTAEQARELEAQHPVIAFSPEQARQTEERNSPLIPSESGISGKQHTRTGENTVDLEMLHSDEYKQKFNGITGNPAVDRRLYEQAVAQLTHRNGTYKEDMVLIDSVTGKIVGRQTRSQSEIGVDYNDSLRRAFASYPRGRLISLHNHPTNNPPTGSDLASASKKGFALGVIATHNGRVFTYKTGESLILAELFDATVDKYRGMGYNEVEAIIITLQKYAESHDIEWSER